MHLQTALYAFSMCNLCASNRGFMFTLEGNLIRSGDSLSEYTNDFAYFMSNTKE